MGNNMEYKKRGKMLILNSLTSLVSQAGTVLCGFILTRLILRNYGSSVNGLVSSITQFLGFISFLEMGIGAVVKSALYKPLANKDNIEISKIVLSCKQFYRRIAIILIVYSIVLMLVFPIITNGFSWLYTASLVLIIAISLFVQYFFGIPYQLLLNADQRAYIPTTINCITLLLSTLISIIAIKTGASIHVVKLVASLIYIIRPIAYSAYVDKHYGLTKKIRLTEEPLKQKWNGMAQHIAYVVVNYTDIVVLTLMSTLADVSIYTVYHNVTIGIQQIISSISIGMSAMLGNVLYTEAIDKTRETFELVEWFFHSLTVLMFSITGVLIVPFVKIYTAGIADANYIIPTFAIIITFAQASYSIRIPYETMVLAANHFRQTQKSALMEALINIVVSVILVKWIGLVGVAIGTLAAMAYRTMYFIVYLKNNIIHYRATNFFRLLSVDLLQTILIAGISSFVLNIIPADNWTGWFLNAIAIGTISLVIVVTINMLINRVYVAGIYSKVMKKHNAIKDL